MQLEQFIKLWCFLFAVNFAGAPAMYAADSAELERPLSLSQCIQLALQHNLDVKIARYGPEIERHNLASVRAAYEPVLGFSGTYEMRRTKGGVDAQDARIPGTQTKGESYRAGITGVLPTGLRFDLGGDLSGSSGFDAAGPFNNANGSASIRLHQPLLRDFWIDNTRLSIIAGKKQLKISEYAFREEVMTIITAVEVAYYDLLLAQGRVKIQEQAVQLAERHARDSAKRVIVGTMARLDEKQAESQVSARRADLFGAQGAYVAREYDLKNLLSDNIADWATTRIKPTGDLTAVRKTFALQESWRHGLIKRPELLKMRLDLERQGVILKYLHNQIFPQLDIVGSYGLAGAGKDFGDAFGGIGTGSSSSYSVGVVLSIPMGGNRAARENFRAGKAELNQSVLRLKKMEQDIMVQIGIAVEEARTRFAQVDATRKSRLYAESALDAAQKKFENGKSTSFEVLLLQRDLTTAQLAELFALADYNKALARLSLREGTVLERNRCTLTLRYCGI